MTYWEIGFATVTLLIYCLINAAIMTGLFVVVQPAIPFASTLKSVLIKTVLSVLIVFGFFALIARMFCWTAWLAECLTCICPALTTETFILQSTLPASILFFFGATCVQAAIVAIPPRFAPLPFLAIVTASNLIASLLKLGIVSLWV